MEENTFSCYCWQAFSTEEILKCHINDQFKSNDKKMIQMPREGDYVTVKNYE